MLIPGMEYLLMFFAACIVLFLGFALLSFVVNVFIFLPAYALVEWFRGKEIDSD